MLTVSRPPRLSSPQTVLAWSAYSNSLNYALYKTLKSTLSQSCHIVKAWYFSLAKVNYRQRDTFILSLPNDKN